MEQQTDMVTIIPENGVYSLVILRWYADHSYIASPYWKESLAKAQVTRMIRHETPGLKMIAVSPDEMQVEIERRTKTWNKSVYGEMP